MTRQVAVLVLFLLVLTYQQAVKGTNETAAAQTRENRTAGESSCQQKKEREQAELIAILSFFATFFAAPLLTQIFHWVWIKWRKNKKRMLALQYYTDKYRGSKIEAIPQEEYQQALNDFKQLIEEVRIRTKIFSFFDYDYSELITREVLVSSFTVKRKQQYEAQILLKARDSKGSWVGKGRFILTEAGPFFWMIKWYNDRQKWEKNAKETMVFESTRISSEGAQGRWFFRGKEKNKYGSNTWEITDTPIIGGPKP